jgi:hypothetical protein
MSLTFQPGFPRRRNEDGSYDSMCLECLQIVANQCPEPQLSRFEEMHVCKSKKSQLDSLQPGSPSFWSNSLRPSPVTAR